MRHLFIAAILIVVVVVSCDALVPRTETRIICNDGFTSKWFYHLTIKDSSVRFYSESTSGYYHHFEGTHIIPDEVMCLHETRNKV